MRRISLAFALAALLPSVAHAQKMHHVMRISEILLSSGGDDAVQFVELTDANNEPFPDGDYVLAVYDADGGLIDSEIIAVPNPTSRYYVATIAADAVFGPDGDAELTIALPAAGQVCFERDNGVKIACTSYGCINTVVTAMNETTEGASPPDGMSLQRQTNATYELADPTPDATNTAGDPAPACPTDPDAGPSAIDAGTDGDADAGPGSPDGGGSGGDGDGGNGDEDSGCGCRASASSNAVSTMLLLAALFAIRRRRVRGRGTRT